MAAKYENGEHLFSLSIDQIHFFFPFFSLKIINFITLHTTDNTMYLVSEDGVALICSKLWVTCNTYHWAYFEFWAHLALGATRLAQILFKFRLSKPEKRNGRSHSWIPLCLFEIQKSELIVVSNGYFTALYKTLQSYFSATLNLAIPDSNL